MTMSIKTPSVRPLCSTVGNYTGPNTGLGSQVCACVWMMGNQLFCWDTINFEMPIGYSKQLSSWQMNICLELKVGLRTVVQIWEGPVNIWLRLLRQEGM